MTRSRLAPDRDREQWHRQLLGRSRHSTVEEVVEATAGIYSTAPTSYLSLAARTPAFDRGDLDRALYRDRTLVRTGALRGSGFLIPIGRVDSVLSAADREPWYLGAVDKEIGPEKRSKWTREVLDILDGRIVPARNLRTEMGIDTGLSTVLRFLLIAMGQRRLIVAAGEPGGWRSNQYGYARWEQWFEGHERVDVDPTQARADLATWYLGGHGPASVEDFSWWSGLSKANAREAIEAAGESRGGDLYDLPGRADPDSPSGLRLLPIWDTALVTQKSRRLMVDPGHYRYTYDASGNVTSTIVSDARVIGVWDRRGDDRSLLVSAAFFTGDGPRGAVEAEAAVVAASVGAVLEGVEWREGPVDLTAAKRNRFMSPLSGG